MTTCALRCRAARAHCRPGDRQAKAFLKEAALVLVPLCFTKDLVGFVIDTICTILCILRHIFKQLIQRLQLTPVITTVSRLRRGFAGVADLVLVHAVSVAAGGLLVIF